MFIFRPQMLLAIFFLNTVGELVFIDLAFLMNSCAMLYAVPGTLLIMPSVRSAARYMVVCLNCSIINEQLVLGFSLVSICGFAK